MANDYFGSVAQGQVDFSTGISVTTSPGANLMKTMIFIYDESGYITSAGEEYFKKIDDDGAEQGPVTLHDIATVTKSSYSSVAQGRLLTWLADLFCNGNPYECLLVRTKDATIVPSTTFDEEAKTDLQTIYNKVKHLAYHKTILVETTDDKVLIPEVALYFAQLCAADAYPAGDLSSVPYYPYVIPADGSIDLAAHTLYRTLKNAGARAFMTAHADSERNSSLFSIGMALATLNNSGTPVGTNIEMKHTSLITPSGQPDPDDFVASEWESYNLSDVKQTTLQNNFIAYFKTVGDTSGEVVAIGDQSIEGGSTSYIIANWIVSYCNHVGRIKVAQYITRGGVKKTALTYAKIMEIVMGLVYMFGANGSGALSNIAMTAPGFDALPAASSRELIIPNAWQANYGLGLRKVTVYSSLEIAT